MAYKILIIDDDTELLKMLKKFLEIKKYEIITAENRIAERTQILRAPLSVLKGYQEMLTEYLPGEDIDMGQAMEMLSESGRQIEHMDAFVEAMRKLKSLENRQLTPGNIFARQLEKDIQGELAILKKECGKQCVLQASESKEEFYGDKEVILEVTENFLSNALRHGKRQITIEIGIALEAPMAILAFTFCADTYTQEIAGRRSEIWRLCPMKKKINSIYRWIVIQEMFLMAVAAIGYGLFFLFQNPDINGLGQSGPVSEYVGGNRRLHGAVADYKFEHR